MLPSERIKQLVEDSKITYTELEKKTGISKSALQRYASGITKKIPIDAVEIIANAFGVTAAYIMGWQEGKPANKSEFSQMEKAPANKGELCKGEHAHIEKYRLLTPKSQNAVDTLIDNLLDAEQDRQVPAVTFGRAAAFGGQSHTTRLTKEDDTKADEALYRYLDRQDDKE